MTSQETAIETRRGDILRADDMQALVNPVNCLGTMGKGLARQFADRYPQIVIPYRQACQNGNLTTERCFVQRIRRKGMPQHVVNLATKNDWRNPSRIEWINAGLQDMYRQLAALDVTSVGLPALGAGLGGLPWEAVLTVIKRHAGQNPDIRTVVFKPKR